MTSTAQLVTQQYIANSCTLEITAAESALSQWSQQPVLKQVRFRVLIEDPETEQPALLTQGNQTQLQKLTDAVQEYVQTHLATSSITSGATGTLSGSISGGDADVGNVFTTSAWPLGQHRLTVDPGADPLTLSTLDLFDLAEVLDQCGQSLQLLPTIASTTGRRRRPFLKSYSLWAGSAVAAMVLAVGVTQTLRQQYETALSPQADIVSESAAISQDEQDVDQARRDAAGDAVGNIAADASGVTNSAANQSIASEALENSLPGAVQARPGSAATTPSQQTVSPADRTEQVPRRQTQSASSARSGLSGRPTSPAAQRAPDREAANSDTREADPVSPVAPSVVVPSIAEVPPAASPPAPAPSVSSPETLDSQLGELRLGATLPETAASAENLEGLSFEDFSVDGSSSSGSSAANPNLGSSEITGRFGTPSQDALESHSFSTGQSESDTFSGGSFSRGPVSLAEAITLNEVTAYFQQRWQGNENGEPLVYEMQLNPMGTVAAIEPLNVPALRQRWSIPEDAIATPFNSEDLLILRVVLYPDGQVQVSD